MRPFVACFPSLSSTGFPPLSNTGYSNLNTCQSPFISRSRLSFRYVSIAACILCSFFLLFPSITMSSILVSIKALASSKGMSVNAYMQDLVKKDQCGLFDTMQIAEKNREMISGITGNMHDGYDIIFKDGHSCHCRTKKDVRSCIIEYCNEKGD